MNKILSKKNGYIFILIVIGLILRLWGINFGLPLKYARPDEDQIVETSIYLFTGDYNPHFYYYPHLFIYLNHFLYRIIYYLGYLAGTYENYLDFVKNFIISPSLFFLVPRLFSAFVGTFTIWLTYITARRFYGKEAGIFSSSLLTFAYLHIRDSHFGTTDICLTASILLTAFFTAKILQNGKGYISSAIAGGIAAGFKYNGALSSIFVFTAHLLFYLKSGKGIKRALLDLKIYLTGILMTIIFLVTSPGLIPEYETFLKKLKFMAKWIYQSGKTNLEIGWLFYLKTTLLSGIGFPFLLLSLIGFLYMLYRHKYEDIVLLSFPLFYYIYIGNGYGVFSRYMIPIIPFLAIYAGNFLVEIYQEKGILKKKGKIVSVTLLTIAIIPSLLNAVKCDILMSKKDTRIEAREWIENNIPFGSRIYLYSSYKYNIPYLERGKEAINREISIFEKVLSNNNRNHYRLYLDSYRYMLKKGIIPLRNSYEYIFSNNFTEEDIEKYKIEYLITGNSFLLFYSSPIEKVMPIIKRRFRLIKTFSPLKENIEKPSKAVFDILDAFYLPLSGFDEFEKPGPLIKIYALKKD
ncbi:MAG: hypothetical protein D6734_06020 [Candidatus Schekmanbacteria bacterium]|nr:MAG: hypothetical protein D6734_06020 [Candidatus Schekmanbacteria bacterium]